MKTLVIHPYDKTTRMLALCYEGKDWTIISDPTTSKKDIKNAIKKHDRIIMMGHGTKHGLMALLGLYNYRYLIDASMLYLLRDDKELIGIWCNADEFFEKYDLKGFYTGMIISEIKEAYESNIPSNGIEVEESNKIFGDALTKSVDSDDMLTSMKELYIGDTPVINYNKVRLFKKD